MRVTFQDEKDDKKKLEEKKITTVNIYDHDYPVIIPEPTSLELQRIEEDKYFGRYTWLSFLIVIGILAVGSLSVALGFLIYSLYNDDDVNGAIFAVQAWLYRDQAEMKG